MIRVVVLDTTAESRTRLLDEATFLLSPAGADINLVPRTSVRPLSPQELRYHSAPDICIIGPELALSEGQEILKVREIIPSSALVIRLPDEQPGIALFDQFARLGVDEVLAGELTAPEFLRRVVLLSRRSGKKSNGKLILVDGGKGGLGVTSVTAALGEALHAAGKTAVLIDLDFETQDLSRFLQARPFINENLRLLFDEQRPVTEDSVKECLVPLAAEEGFFLMPPVQESDDLYDSRAQHSRTILSVLEILDSTFDCVVVDMSSVRGELRKVLCHTADKLVFTVNNDPACFYASLDRLSKTRCLLSSGAQLILLENCSLRHGISDRFLRSEFSRAARLDESSWASESIGWCRQGARWPGSGATLFSASKAQVAKSFTSLLCDLEIVDSAKQAGVLSGIFSFGRRRKENAAAIENPLLIGESRKDMVALPPGKLPAAKEDQVVKVLLQPGRSSEEVFTEFLVSAPQFAGSDNRRV